MQPNRNDSLSFPNIAVSVRFKKPIRMPRGEGIPNMHNQFLFQKFTKF